MLIGFCYTDIQVVICFQQFGKGPFLFELPTVSHAGLNTKHWFPFLTNALVAEWEQSEGRLKQNINAHGFRMRCSATITYGCNVRYVRTLVEMQSCRVLHQFTCLAVTPALLSCHRAKLRRLMRPSSAVLKLFYEKLTTEAAHRCL